MNIKDAEEKVWTTPEFYVLDFKETRDGFWPSTIENTQGEDGGTYSDPEA